MSCQSHLDKLMQMATIEQLNSLVQQLNSNVSKTNTNTNANALSNQEILSLPIVQKVVLAYEAELNATKNISGCQCNCQELNQELLQKMEAQHSLYVEMDTKITKIMDSIDRLTNSIASPIASSTPLDEVKIKLEIVEKDKEEENEDDDYVIIDDSYKENFKNVIEVDTVLQEEEEVESVEVDTVLKEEEE